MFRKSKKCAICKSKFTKENVAYVNFDLQTGQVRELLCIECNTGIGVFGDSEDLLDAAAQYLKSHKRYERFLEQNPELGDQ